MNKIICNTVDFVFLNEIEKMDLSGAPVLKSGITWKNIQAIENPVYRSSINQNDAGPVNEETVSVKARRNNLTELLMQYFGFHTVLRMRTDIEVFYVGNPEYPCRMEYESDKVFDNYSFKSVSPA